jgi:ribosomal protein S18 acetylase RimI-like enzyme
MSEICYRWRGEIDNATLNELHAEAFEHRVFDDDWAALTTRHSLGWVVAADDQGLVGFVNVPWDGAVHAWLQDTIVARRARRLGVGRRLCLEAVSGARAAECEWLHVDFDDELRPFYFDACGFSPTNAGLIELT